MRPKRFIVYNCGYYQSFTMNGNVTGKKYRFLRRMVTEVDESDYDYFIGLTADDIPWCQQNSKTIPPFMDLEDWCLNKEGRFDKGISYKPEEYLKVMLLTNNARNN